MKEINGSFSKHWASVINNFYHGSSEFTFWDFTIVVCICLFDDHFPNLVFILTCIWRSRRSRFCSVIHNFWAKLKFSLEQTFKLVHIDMTIAILVKNVENWIDIRLGKHLLSVQRRCDKFLMINLSISVDIDRFEEFVPINLLCLESSENITHTVFEL